MKRAVLIATIIATIQIYSQVLVVGSPDRFKQGDVDATLSVSTGVGFSKFNEKSSSERYYSYDTSYYKTNHTYSNRPLNLILSATMGYYIIDGLAFEPELDINIIVDAELSISLLGNLSYNFSPPGKKSHPFIRLGYGLSNYYRQYSSWYGGETEDNSLDTKVFTAGAGYKLQYSSGFSMKVEVNYKNFSYSTISSHVDETSKFSSETEENMDVVSLSFGFIIFL